MTIRDPGWRQFGSGIRDGKKSDPGSGIKIPDPQHWQIPIYSLKFIFKWSCRFLICDRGEVIEHVTAGCTY
jgi:hypothetical protein